MQAAFPDRAQHPGGEEVAASRSNCSAKPNRVYASNTVANASKGLTSIPVTPGG